MTWPSAKQPAPPSFRERLLGHRRTLTTFFERSRDRSELPPTEPFETSFETPDVGEVRLTGRLHRGSLRRLVLFVHGLGGNSDSGYMRAGLRAAARIGASALLLNLRGADRRGHDFYHAGLVEDLEAALAALPEYERVEIFGYSLGGHVTFAYAASRPDPRVRRVAAVGTPLDLSISARAFDASDFSVYRKHVLDSLHQIYTAAFQRRPTGLVPEHARRIRKIVEWDERIVAPRFGFSGADDYYRSVSVASKLTSLSVPALYVGAPADPMIPIESVIGAADSPHLEVHWARDAGHLGFRSDFDLGMDAPRGLEEQVLAWLGRP